MSVRKNNIEWIRNEVRKWDNFRMKHDGKEAKSLGKWLSENMVPRKYLLKRFEIDFPLMKAKKELGGEFYKKALLYKRIQIGLGKDDSLEKLRPR